MFRGINLLRLIPDRPGRGGTKFGYHAFQQEPINDTRQTLNVHVWQDSWRTDTKSTGTFAENIFFDTNAGMASTLGCLALHGYCKYSTTSPSDGPLTEILGQNVVNPQNADATAYIWNYTSYVDWTITPPPAVTLTWDQNTVCAADPKHPAVFVNVGNRCFIATGINECQIYDSSSGDDVFGNGSGQPHVYDLGIGAPTAMPLVEPADTVAQTPVWLHIGSKYVTDPDPSGGLSTITYPAAGVEVESDGTSWTVAGGTDVTLINGTSTFSTAAMTVDIANGSNIAYFTGAMPTDGGWMMLTLTVNGLEFQMTAFASAPTPDADLLLLGVNACRLDKPYRARRVPADPNDPSAPVWNPSDDIVDMPFMVTGYRATMQRGGVDVTWPGGGSMQPTMLGNLLNAGGAMTWAETPPSYAYAWYDPLSGHISNISPVFQPEATSQTDVGVKISIDVGSISYPGDTTHIPTPKLGVNPFPRWTHILFFRSLMSGGSTLYPIGSLQPFVFDPEDPTNPRRNPEWKGLPNYLAGQYYFPPATTGNYWIDSSRDADLLVSGALRAPQFTNGKPTYTNEGESVVIYPSHMAYWDGRLWMAGTQDPAAIHYSCDRVQCPFGVPEESFPDTNVLRIPASDGCIRGMKLIGESLLITTERWAYTIAGNNEANYRLVRISTRMAGVGDYQMDEFVSDVEGQTSLVVFIGTDSKVYAMPLGGQAVCISKDIQTYLSSMDRSFRVTYNESRIHCMSVDGRRMVLLYVPGPYPLVNGKTFIYDFDQKIWTEHTLSTDASDTNEGRRIAWATTPSQTDGSIEIYSASTQDTIPPISPYPQVKLRRWFQYGSTPMAGGYARTFPLNFDGKKTRKRLHFVRIYVNDRSFQSQTVTPPIITLYPWRISVITNSEATPKTATFVSEYDATYNMMATGGVPVDSPDAAELIVTDAALSPDMPIYGYTFDVTVLFPTQVNKLYQLYAMEIGWSTASEGQEDI